jgi:uncharacterized membrane protein YdjX (TVP38/TMEM64 family)
MISDSEDGSPRSRLLPPIFTSQRTRTVTLLILAVLVVVFAASAVLFGRYLPDLSDPVAIRRTVAGYGPVAPLVFVALQSLQVIVAPVPGHVLGLASGYLFGAVLGTVYSLAGAVLGSVVVFLLARRFGRSYAERVIREDTLSAFDDLIERRGLVTLFVVFLIPGLPDDAVCLMGGLTRIPIWQLAVVSAVGRIPGFYLTNLAGAGVAEGNLLTVALIAVVLAVASAIALWQREPLLDWLRLR